MELDEEGIAPDLDSLLKISGLDVEATLARAQSNGTTLLQYLIKLENGINFQNFDRAKKAFNKVYGLKFGEIGARGDEIARLRDFLNTDIESSIFLRSLVR